MRILAAAAQYQQTADFLETMQAFSVDPRGLLAAPAPYAQILAKLAGEGGEAVAIVDIGHSRSDVCIAQAGKPIFARSIAKGGRHLTAAISKTWNVDTERAELAKHNDGIVYSSRYQPQTDASTQLSDVLTRALGPLVRELRRTLNGARAKTGFVPESIVLVGGGSRLQGLSEFLSDSLGVPVSTVSESQSAGLLGAAASMGRLDSCALALGVAMDGAAAKPSFDLRKGDLAFKADMSFLRTKVKSIALAAMVAVGFGIFSGYMGVTKLKNAEKVLDKRVALESAAAFGQALSAEEVKGRVGAGKGWQQSQSGAGDDSI